MANSTIKFPQEMPPAATINGSDKIMIADAATNEAKSATWDAAKQYLTIEGQKIKSVPPGPLSPGPAGETRFMEVGQGTWTFSGSNFVVPANNRGVLWWSGSNWSLSDVYEIPSQDLTPVYEKIEYVEDVILTKSKNLNDPLYAIMGFSVSYVTGVKTATSANSKMVENLPIEGGQVYTISGLGSINNLARYRLGTVFLDALGNKLKPIKSDGVTPYAEYSLTESDDDMHGGVITFYAPSDAVTISYTINYGSAPIPAFVQLEKGAEATPYTEPYGQVRDEVLENFKSELNDVFESKFNTISSIKTGLAAITTGGDIIKGTTGSYDVYFANVTPLTKTEVRYQCPVASGVAYYDEFKVFQGFIENGNGAIKTSEFTAPSDCHFIAYQNLIGNANHYIKGSSPKVILTFEKDVTNELTFKENTQLLPANGNEAPKTGVKTSDKYLIKKGQSFEITLNQVLNTGSATACIYKFDNTFLATMSFDMSGTITRKYDEDCYLRFSTLSTQPYSLKLIRVENEQESIFDDTLQNTVTELKEKADLAFQFDEYYKNRKNTSLEIVSAMKAMGVEPKWYGYQYVEKYVGTEFDIRIASSEEAMSLHAELPIQNKVRRCVTHRYTGDVLYYLDANNSLLKEDGVTPSKLDGTDGNFMVEVPDYYYKCVRETVNIAGVDYLKVTLKISEFCIEPDWIFSRKCYTSAIEAIVDRSKNELCSVVTANFSVTNEEVRIENSNRYVAVASGGVSLGVHKKAVISSFTSDASRYRGGYNNSDYDNTVIGEENFERNQLARPVAFINRGGLNEMVPNSNFTVHKYDTLLALTVLYIVEYGNTNAQLPFSNNSPEGYKTGGTGMGSTVYPDYNAFEYFWLPQGGGAVLPQGITATLGNKTGEMYYYMTNVPTVYTGTASTPGVVTQRGNVWMPVLSYRGVEQFYGHLYKIIEQVNINVYLDENNVKQADLYYQPNPYRLSDISVDGYQYLGKNSTTGNYVEEMRFTEDNNRYSMLSKSAKAALGDGTKYGGDFAENLFHGATKEPKVYYTTFNGRIVSKDIVGLFFSCAMYPAVGTLKRPSDTTRLDHY